MTTTLTANDLLDWSVQFIHLEKILSVYPGMSDNVSANLFGIDVDIFHEVQAKFAARTWQAAEELLADSAFAANVDRIPFAAGSKVVAVGSSSTDDLESWFEILRQIFK